MSINRTTVTTKAVTAIGALIEGRRIVPASDIYQIIDEVFDAARQAGYSDGYDEGMEYGIATANPPMWED